MLNWSAVLRRILKLYRVETVQELGMALGARLRPEHFASGEIPWILLERIVGEKNVSWDWLLTGKQGDKAIPEGHTESPSGDNTPAAIPGQYQTVLPPIAPGAETAAPPAMRAVTRELQRALLDGSSVPRQKSSEPTWDNHRQEDKEDSPSGLQERIQDAENEAELESELLPSATTPSSDNILNTLSGIRQSLQNEVDRLRQLERGWKSV